MDHQKYQTLKSIHQNGNLFSVIEEASNEAEVSGVEARHAYRAGYLRAIEKMVDTVKLLATPEYDGNSEYHRALVELTAITAGMDQLLADDDEAVTEIILGQKVQ